MSFWEKILDPQESGFLIGISRIFLGFCAQFYGGIIRVRNGAYDLNIFSTHRVSVPVISIGNISMGGTGKTSLTVWCAHFFLQNRKKPVIISRGYGRAKGSPPIQVMTGSSIPHVNIVGDEPSMMFNALKQVPIIVGADRVLCAKRAVQEFAPDVILLDDGFQHRRLFRNLDIVNIDDTFLEISNIFPRGVLREGWDSLKRAHFIVVKTQNSNSLFIEQQVRQFNLNLEMAFFHYQAESVVHSLDKKIEELQFLHQARLIVVSAIANPKSFEKILKDLGAEIVMSKHSPDHYFFTVEDLNSLKESAVQMNAQIITTEKDAVRIPPHFDFLILKVKLEWRSGESELSKKLLSCVQ